MAAIAIVLDTTFERNARRCPAELPPFEVVDFGTVYATADDVSEARHIAMHRRCRAIRCVIVIVLDLICNEMEVKSVLN